MCNIVFWNAAIKVCESTADLDVKLAKIPGVIKGRFYVSASLSDSWESFTPPHAGVTLGRFYTSW